MDFYKLTDFQLYSIINSRHLDKANKTQAERELERRNLSEDRMHELQDELSEKSKTACSFFSFNPNTTWFLVIAVVVVIIMLKQCVVH